MFTSVPTNTFLKVIKHVGLLGSLYGSDDDLGFDAVPSDCATELDDLNCRVFDRGTAVACAPNERAEKKAEGLHAG